MDNQLLGIFNKVLSHIITSVASARLLMPLAMFLLSLKSISVIEEVNNLQCTLIVSQLIVYTDRLKWPVAKQWEQSFVKGIVSSL